LPDQVVGANRCVPQHRRQSDFRPGIDVVDIADDNLATRLEPLQQAAAGTQSSCWGLLSPCPGRPASGPLRETAMELTERKMRLVL